jgi:hypothetical protein
MGKESKQKREREGLKTRENILKKRKKYFLN